MRFPLPENARLARYRLVIEELESYLTEAMADGADAAPVAWAETRVHEAKRIVFMDIVDL